MKLAAEHAQGNAVLGYVLCFNYGYASIVFASGETRECETCSRTHQGNDL